MSFRISVTNRMDPVRNFVVQFLEGVQKTREVRDDLKARYKGEEGWSVKVYEYHEYFEEVTLP